MIGLLGLALAGDTMSFEVVPTLSTHHWKLQDGTTVRHPFHYINVGELTGITPSGFTVEAETSGLWQLAGLLLGRPVRDGVSKDNPQYHGQYATLMSISLGNCPWELSPSSRLGWRFTPLHVAAWALYDDPDEWGDYAAFRGGLGLPIGTQALWEPWEEELFFRASVQWVPWFNMQQFDGELMTGWSIKTDVDIVWEATRFVYIVGNAQSEVFPTYGNDLNFHNSDQPNKGRHFQAGVGVAIPTELFQRG